MTEGFSSSQAARVNLGAAPPDLLKRRLRWLGAWGVVLVAAFFSWLLDWVQFARNDELASYVLLIPFVSASLIWQRRATSSAGPGINASLVPGFAALLAGAVFLALALVSGRNQPGRFDYLSAAMAAFLFLALAGGFFFLGKDRLKPHRFALAFLAFAIPIPSWGVHALEVFFQHTSAEVAAVFIDWARLPVLRDGLIFQLPGITLQVAQECSGIRSSLILFITSLVAGSMLLQRPWTRAVLALAVIPLGIVRNAFRILTIAMLCVHVNPDMVDSPIHHRGGPLFFVLSLIPFFGLLLLLRRWEKPAASANHKLNEP